MPRVGVRGRWRPARAVQRWSYRNVRRGRQAWRGLPGERGEDGPTDGAAEDEVVALESVRRVDGLRVEHHGLHGLVVCHLIALEERGGGPHPPVSATSARARPLRAVAHRRRELWKPRPGTCARPAKRSAPRSQLGTGRVSRFVRTD